MLKSERSGATPRPTSPATDRVTVVLFKDHHHPRSFEVSLGWVKKMGAFIGLAALITLLSLGSALRSGWIARTSRPEALKRMEEENRNLRTSNESLERQVGDLQEQAKLLAQNPASTPSEISSQSTTSSPTPIASNLDTPTSLTPEQKKTEVAGELPQEKKPLRSLWDRLRARYFPEPEGMPSGENKTAQTSASTPGNPSNAPTGTPAADLTIPSGLPAFVPVESWMDGLPDPAQLKIALSPATTQLRGGRLSLKFAIQYTANDGKNQQGRIVLLARGPSGILAYPDGVLNGMGVSTLVAPERGEFFSVGRYREVATDFELPQSSAGSFKEVEVLLFKTDGKILVHQKIDVTNQPAPAERAPRPPKPAPTGDIILPPGTDR